MEPIKMDQYLGSDKVKNVELGKRKTYFGKNVWLITLETDNKAIELPEEVAVKAFTAVPSNATDLRDRMLDPLIEKMMVLLLEQEIKIIDIEYLIQRMRGTVNHHLENAENIVWGKDATYDKTLGDVNNVIKNNGKTTNKTKDTPTADSPRVGKRQKRKRSVEL